MLLPDLKSSDPYFNNYILCQSHACSSKSIIFLFALLIYVIFSNRKLQIVNNYIHKVVIKFLFCMVSLHRTSRYVLICCTCLTHFLCCNLFVMSYLTLSAISANILEIRLPSLSVTLYGWLISSRIPCNALLQRFPRMFSKFA